MELSLRLDQGFGGLDQGWNELSPSPTDGRSRFFDKHGQFASVSRSQSSAGK